MVEQTLHEKYAPILHFASRESFLPMDASDYLSYTSLYDRSSKRARLQPGHVTPADLVSPRREDGFLRSVTTGPLLGSELAREWGADTLDLLRSLGRATQMNWSAVAARKLYDWFSSKTSAATRHFWWNSLLMPGGSTELRESLPRLSLPTSMRRAALNAYLENQGASPKHAYHYRTTRQGNLLVLQYWLFYAFNDWANAFGGFNDHEGDWEGIQLFFQLQGGRPVEPPTHVLLLGHESRIAKPWNHPEIEKSGSHPHVFVAAGSHASYPERKRYDIMSLYGLIDYATGDGVVVEPDMWRRRVDLNEMDWITRFGGSWGTRYWLSFEGLQRVSARLLQTLVSGLGTKSTNPGTELAIPGVSAPRGPRFAADGAERETWNRSAAFADLI